MRLRIIDSTYLAILVSLLICTLSVPIAKLRDHQILVPTNAQGQPANIADFLHFYEAGQLVSNPATRTKVYDPAVQLAWQLDFLRPMKIDRVFYIQYVPFIFPLMIPCGMLPAETSYCVWTLISLALSALAVVLLNQLSPRSKVEKWAFLVGLLLCLPAWINIFIGQLGLVLFFLVSLYFWSLSKKKDFTGGIALALTSIKPHYALFLAIPALAEKRWRLIATAAVTEVLLLTLAGLTIGWPNVFGYPRILMEAETSHEILGVHPEKEICLRGLFSTFMSQESALHLSLLFMVIGLAAMLCLWIKQSKGADGRSRHWLIACTILTCLITSPHSNSYDWVLIAIGAWLTVPSFQWAAILGTKDGAFKAWTCLFLFYPLLSWALFLSGTLVPSQVSFPTLALLCLHLVLLGCAIKCIAVREPA